MDVLVERAAGIDIHKKTAVVCVRLTSADGSVERLSATFSTMTADLLKLSAWLTSLEISHVVMESTGEFWKPLYNLLEGNFEILVVNAQHVKHVPGRKSDMRDAEWLSELLAHGLLRASFIPPQAQRDLRDLTRQRTNLVRDRATVVNRLQKVLEWSNIKLAAVATDVLGVSARAMLEAIVLVNFAYQVDDGVVDLLVAARHDRGLPSLWALLTTTAWMVEERQSTNVVALPVLNVPQVGPVRYEGIARVVRNVIQLSHQLNEFDELVDFRMLMTAIRITAQFDDWFPKERALEDYESLFTVLADYLAEGAEQGLDLLDRLNQILLLDDPPLDERAGDRGKVQIMTIHKSKGLEFDTVFVPGMEEGTLPSERAESDDQTLEEGRVCYVALTRARHTLVLSMVPTRQRGNERPASRYLEAIQQVTGRRLTRPPLPISRAPRHRTGPIKVIWTQGLRRLRRVVELTIDLTADEQRFVDAPATIVIDISRIPMSTDVLPRLEQMLEMVPGAFPVEILIDEVDDGPQRISSGQRICGDKNILELLRASTGLPVWREAILFYRA